MTRNSTWRKTAVRLAAALLAMGLMMMQAAAFAHANRDATTEASRPAAAQAPGKSEAEQPEAPNVSAAAAALIDVKSGRLLYVKNGDAQLLIASLTKIMTAIVAIEHGNLSDIVKVGPNAYGKEGSSLYLKLGEEMSLENMLYGLMLRSGNDAAVAIAEHVGGSVEGFAYLMNRKAEELGLAHTHFVNPHGLDADGHYSSAVDLAKLTAYALKNPSFREIVKTPTKTAPNPNGKWRYTWRNKNKMLHYYEGADGVKTGYTKAAGRGLVSSASRNGQQLAVVTIDAPSDWADHTALLDFGFAHYPLETIVEKGEPLHNTKLVPAAAVTFPLTEREKQALKLTVAPESAESDDYRFGVRGTLRIELNGERIATVKMVDPAAADLPAAGKSDTRWEALRSYWSRVPASARAVWTTMFRQ